MLTDAFVRVCRAAGLTDRLAEPASCVQLERPPGGSTAGLVAGLLGAGQPGPIVVIADTPGEADAICEDLDALLASDTFRCFPQRESLPYEDADPHVEISAQRSEALAAFLVGRLDCLVTTARGLIERASLPAAGEDFGLELQEGQSLSRAGLLDRLEAMGFERVQTLRDVGELAVRGAIVDIFPYGESYPVRIELWDDEVASMRRFDPFTQRSTERIDSLRVLPIEVRDTDGPRTRRSVLELLPDSAALILTRPTSLPSRQVKLWEETVVARRRAGSVTPPGDLVLEPDAAAASTHGRRRIEFIDDASGVGLDIAPPPPIERDMGRLIQVLGAASAEGRRALVLCDNQGQLERLEEIIVERGSRALAADVTLAIGTLSGGFRLETPPLLVLTDHEIFRRSRRFSPRGRFRGSATLESIASIQPGDYVVHMDHGIGRFRGMERVEIQGETIETLEIEYADGEVLRLPHYRLDLLERYSTGEDLGAPPPPVHKLGGKRWKQLKRKTVAAIEETAVELLQLYARRQLADGFAFAPESTWQREMEAAFLYDETPDQLRAWEAVRFDMEEAQPMDRLVCGDVGFGKTEVAMRAAFKAVQDGKQVAVLAPTTVLADQHLRTFGERLAAFPLVIEGLSRFQTPSEQKRVIADLSCGEVDIVIGTHRLLSGDITFRDLGLLVVDEEQRFGVRQKERLKELREAVDVLTLTATPIPRTLHLAMGGIRDLSLIQTPPANRRPIITHVLQWDDTILEDALTRELDRGGQTFFVHDRVETIDSLARRVERLVPGGRIEVAHGQMPERDLEATMRAFAGREIDVLVCTSIIENGLDVSSANTMIVHRADRFGLAQLYQLRGRVGRSHRRAYCYLLIPPGVSRDAERRLRVLEHHTELGAGYQVAVKDLELRGAGNLLGSQQSGFATAVGLETYQRLVASTVRRLKGDAAEDDTAATRVSVEGDSYLPDEYVPDSEQKMHLYRRLSRLTERGGVADLRAELRDRFGPLPAPAERLLGAAELRILGTAVEASWIRLSDREGRITFKESATPRLGLLRNAMGDRQLNVEVRRLQPLSLVLERAGTEPLLPTLADTLRLLAAAEGAPVGAASGGRTT